ncbi:MAG: MBL fold metallo-hydrolase [Bacteroidota bacterium]
MDKIIALVFCFYLISCQSQDLPEESTETTPLMDELPTDISRTTLVVLGNVQDAGSPHIACKKDCCAALFEQVDPTRKVVSLGLIAPTSNSKYLFEASPDMTTQLKMLQQLLPAHESEVPDAIFLTHAHIGHYTGLMYLGKEAMNAQQVPVYAMPRMKEFLANNGPWSQLVSLKNIELRELQDQQAVRLNEQISVIPFRVPHRDEYSETVGYTIVGPNKKALFIPDIDKWEKWDTAIRAAIATVDFAFLDATFFDAAEINNRDISQIPHPFIIESMALFADLPETERNKVHFIHLNPTNPALDPDSEASQLIEKKGFQVARLGDVFEL